MKIYTLLVLLLAVSLSFVLGVSPALAVDGATAAGALPLLGSASAVALAQAPRVRGLIYARAESAPSNLTETLNELNNTFAQFRRENDDRINALERGREDVLTEAHVERINNRVTELTDLVEAQQETIAGLRAGGGSGDGPDAAVREHSQAFNTWFRRGRDPEAGMRELEVNAGLTTQSDPDGGYMVPEEMEQGIDRVLGTVSAIRSLSRVISVGSDEYSKLVNLGGAGSGWVGEEEERPETATPTLSKIVINSGEIYANPATTQRMLDDAVFDVEAWLADEVSIEFAEQEGQSFWKGDGVKKPKGIKSYPTVANNSYAWGKIGFVKTGAASGFNTDNPADAIIDLYYSLKSGLRNGASFLSSDAVLGTVRKFKDGQDNYLWAPPTADMPATVLGKPVATDDNIDALGAGTFPMAFGNFQRGYLITDRTGVRVLRDPYTNKPYVHFYTTKRVGGGVVNFEAIKLLKCAT